MLPDWNRLNQANRFVEQRRAVSSTLVYPQTVLKRQYDQETQGGKYLPAPKYAGDIKGQWRNIQHEANGNLDRAETIVMDVECIPSGECRTAGSATVAQQQARQGLMLMLGMWTGMFLLSSGIEALANLPRHRRRRRATA